MPSIDSCPKCRADIPLADVNVSTDVALCRKCGQTWSYSELIQNDAAAAFTPQSPPNGAWFRETPPQAFEVGVSTRSLGALFLVPFVCVWSAIALGGIYGTQFAKGQFNLTQSLFGVPFLFGALFLGSRALMSAGGKLVVAVDGDSGVIFSGIGPIGTRQRFDWRKVSSIRLTRSRGSRGGIFRRITFEGERQLSFGANVKDARLNFMLAALRSKLRH